MKLSKNLPFEIRKYRCGGGANIDNLAYNKIIISYYD
jgi:hypothetical protein